MKRILFHGTSNFITEFNETSISKGFDPNSALGIHFSDDPSYAAEYAELSLTLNEDEDSEASIYVVSYQSTKQMYIFNYEDFYGDENEDTNNKVHFAELRNTLINSGIDLVEFEGGEDSITTILIPEKIKIIDRISVSQAISLSKYMVLNNITWKMPNKIIKGIEYLKNNIQN